MIKRTAALAPSLAALTGNAAADPISYEITFTDARSAAPAAVAGLPHQPLDDEGLLPIA